MTDEQANAVSVASAMDAARRTEFDLNLQQWHLLHAMIDGVSLMTGISPMTDTAEVFTEQCRDHLEYMHGEAETISRLHVKIQDIIQAIESGSKVIITVVPF